MLLAPVRPREGRFSWQLPAPAGAGNRSDKWLAKPTQTWDSRCLRRKTAMRCNDRLAGDHRSTHNHRLVAELNCKIVVCAVGIESGAPITSLSHWIHLLGSRSIGPRGRARDPGGWEYTFQLRCARFHCWWKAGLPGAMGLGTDDGCSRCSASFARARRTASCSFRSKSSLGSMSVK